MSLADDAMKQVARLFKENNELRAGAEAAKRDLAELRERIAADLDGVAEELRDRADQAGSDNRTGQAVMLVQAKAYAAAAGRIRSQV